MLRGLNVNNTRSSNCELTGSKPIDSVYMPTLIIGQTFLGARRLTVNRYNNNPATAFTGLTVTYKLLMFGRFSGTSPAGHICLSASTLSTVNYSVGCPGRFYSISQPRISTALTCMLVSRVRVKLTPADSPKGIPCAVAHFRLLFGQARWVYTTPSLCLAVQ